MSNFTQAKRETFLQALAVCGSLSDACKAGGIDRSTAFRWRKQDPEFEAQCAAAIDEATDGLEREAHRRAVLGTDEPLTFQGAIFGYVKRYSDSLLTLLLKANRPEKYRENTRMELTGADGGPVKLDDATAANKLAAIFNAVLATRQQDDGRDLV